MLPDLGADEEIPAELGLTPEKGDQVCTIWIQTNTLATIAIVSFRGTVKIMGTYGSARSAESIFVRNVS